MVKFIKIAKSKALTLNGFLKEIKEENEYIKRIRQDEGFIIVETGYNCKGTALN